MAGTNPSKTTQSREARLKAALKANMAKRKAQAKARSAADPRARTEAGKDEQDG